MTIGNRKSGTGQSRSRILLIIFVLTVITFPALAGEEDWQPPPPEPVDFDWVQLVSGEWLKGEILLLENDSLEFDSKKLGRLVLDWADVSQVRSMRIVQALFKDDREAVGKIVVEGGSVRVIGDEEGQFERSQLLRFVVGEPREINFWSGRVELGANFRQGNTDAIDFNTQLMVQRRTIKNRVQAEYIGNYNELEGVESGNNQRVSGSWHRFLTAKLYLMPVYGEYYRDPFLNIAFRGSIGTGLGYTLVDTPKVDWDVSGGPGYQRTDFDEVEEGTSDSEDTPMLGVSTILTVKLVSWLDFNYDYRFQITNEASGTYNHHMMAGLVTDLTGPLSLNTSIVWERIQDPRANADAVFPDQDDYKLTVGLGYDF